MLMADGGLHATSIDARVAASRRFAMLAMLAMLAIRAFRV